LNGICIARLLLVIIGNKTVQLPMFLTVTWNILVEKSEYNTGVALGKSSMFSIIRSPTQLNIGVCHHVPFTTV